MVDIAREQIVPLEEVAKKFGVTLQTVRNWTKRGKHRLEAIRVGRVVRTSWEAVQRFAANSESDPAAIQQIIKQPQVSETHEESCRLLREMGLKF